MGIEPTSLAWEAGILPMNYTRIDFYSLASFERKCKNFADGAMVKNIHCGVLKNSSTTADNFCRSSSVGGRPKI